MTTTSGAELRDLIDRTAVDPSGEKLGTITDVYVDDETGNPTWLAIRTGLFGTRHSLAPLTGVYVGGDDVVVDFAKDVVKDAPNVDVDEHLDSAEEERLYRHYGLDRHAVAGEPATTGTTSGGGLPDDAMTRSEEQVDVSTRQRETGRARLRKWVETENVQMTVPIRREKARLVTEPITADNRGAAVSGPDLTDAEHEVVLTEEVVDVDKRVVAKERVRLETEVETDEVPVNETVRKERIEMDHDSR